jgi:hypothetical protein
MKKLFFNYILALLLFSTCFSYKAGAQNVQVAAKLQQYTIRIGDQVKLFLSVDQPADMHVNFPKLADTIGKVLIVNAYKPDTTHDKNNPKTIEVIQSYTVTCFDAGTYTIPPFEFGTPGGILKSNELTLQVETVKVDTTKAIYDIKQPLAVRYTALDWLKDNWLWIMLPLLGILVIAGLTWYLTKRPKKEIVSPVVKPGLPPHTIALNKLNE